MQITKKSLSKLSFDDTNNKIVCNYQNEFIDLDTTKGILKKQQTPKTPDMLYINDEQKELWFVEFKSSTKDNLNDWKSKVNLRKKIFAGLFITYEIFCQKACDYKEYKKFYFVVFNKEDNNSYEDEVLDIFDENSTRDIEFGLEDLKPQFIEDIFTDNCNNFKQLFEKRFDMKFEN
jgi:hypothetical protein